MGLLGIVWLISQCGGTDKMTGSGTATDRPSSSASSTSTAPDPWKYMAGNGTHEMGGADGKNWGVWVSDGTTDVRPGTNCKWSIRSVASDRPGIVMDEGEAPPGLPVTVGIEPDGDVSAFDGTIGPDNHRIVFMTNNCGAWQPQS